MDFTPIDMPDQQTHYSHIERVNRNRAPLLGQQQELLNGIRNKQFVLVSYRNTCFSSYVTQTQPVTHLLCCVESVKVTVDLPNVHVFLQCKRGMLFTVDGNVYAPQDPEKFYFWKQQGKGYF